MHVDYYDSPIGILKIEADDEGITSIIFTSKKSNKRKTDKNINDCKKQLKEYFSGTRKDFDLKLNMQGTKFQKKVWKTLQKVKFGKTINYTDLGEKTGHKNAGRAIGNCMNKNPVCIVVPCHRVLGKTNKYNYGAGPEKKKWLLNHEEIN